LRSTNRRRRRLSEAGRIGFANAARATYSTATSASGSASPDRWRRGCNSAAGASCPLKVDAGDGSLVVVSVAGGLLLEEQQRLPQLTPREREILDLVAEGRTNADIAEALWVSPGTIRRHLENVFTKLGVHTRTAAAAFVRERRRPFR
jgi:DNA-binding CsgD family transcriptional regulator